MDGPQRLFLESRYRKLVRGLPQTRFYCPRCRGHRRRRVGCDTCDGRGQVTEDSVEELLARRLLPALKAKRGILHGAGREDIDVRMLGRGRPFVFEVIGVRRPDVDLVALRDRFHEHVGDRVQIDPFSVVERPRVGELKEAQHRKLYRIGIATEVPEPEPRLREFCGRTLVLAQSTPTRVLGSRADLLRERCVVVQEVRRAEDGLLEIDLVTDHGTYVKEFLSGDDGRTEPSVAGLLGGPAECARLDVLEILDVEPTEAESGRGT